MKPTAAIIDIGSNSIKVLVAARAPDGRIKVLKTRTIDARISAGISGATPRLGDAAMMSGLGAIRELLAEAKTFSPNKTVLVATSAVRDASNGGEFRSRVLTATGQSIRLLSGDEEAALIGRGLTCDPALATLQDFYVFDLGGGSLECLSFRKRAVENAASLQLGCVRLTEQFVTDPEAPFPADAAEKIAAHVRETVAASKFNFSLPPGSVAVGTGGTITVTRAILAQMAGRTMETSSPDVSLAKMKDLLRDLGKLPLTLRKRVPGLPPPRADVMPTALATLIAIGDLGSLAGFRHSLYNLRYGLADEALA